MDHDALVTFFRARNGRDIPPDASWIAMIEAAETAARRPFAPVYRALMRDVGAIDLGAMDFADPNPAITVGYYPKLVEVGEKWGMPSDAMPIALDNGELFAAFADGRIAVINPSGATGETWPNLASFLLEFMEAG